MKNIFTTGYFVNLIRQARRGKIIFDVTLRVVHLHGGAITGLI